jgi:hypothetical protein
MSRRFTLVPFLPIASASYQIVAKAGEKAGVAVYPHRGRRLRQHGPGSAEVFRQRAQGPHRKPGALASSPAAGDELRQQRRAQARDRFLPLAQPAAEVAHQPQVDRAHLPGVAGRLKPGAEAFPERRQRPGNANKLRIDHCSSPSSMKEMIMPTS